MKIWQLVSASQHTDYISALQVWFIPYFANIDINKINLKALTEFNTWRDHKHGKRFSQSGINNHNAALNKVLDEAELNGWITKAMRPTLLNKGVATQSRGSFSNKEYNQLHMALRNFHTKTTNKKAAATRAEHGLPDAPEARSFGCPGGPERLVLQLQH